MKRIPLIALAMAGVVGTTYAQEAKPSEKFSFSVYGVADLFYGNLQGTNVANASTAPSQNTTQFSGVATGGWSANRLGFKGSADMTDDLSAQFVLELGPLTLDDTTTNAANGNGLTRTRKSFVGLTSKEAGTFTIGRHQSPAFDWSSQFDPSGGAFSSLYALAAAAGAGINAADRVNNAIQWTSPKWAGFTIKENLAFTKESNSSIDDGVAANHSQNVNNFSVTYENGALTMGGVIRTMSNTSGVCGTAASSTTATACSTPGAQPFLDGQKDMSLGGIYDFGVAKLFLTTQVLRKESSPFDTVINQIGATVPAFSKGTVVVSYASGQGKALRGTNEVAQNARAYTVLYNHKLNKSALAYAGYMDVTNSDPANPLGSLAPVSGWTNTPSLVAPNTNTSESVKGFGVGITYTF